MEKHGYDKWFKAIFGRVYNGRFRVNILQALPYWIASLIAGIVAVMYSKVFAVAEEMSLNIIHKHRWLLFLLTPVCFVIAWLLVKKVDPKAGGSGIPQVMASIELATPRYNHLVDKFLSVKSILIKALSSIFMVIGGGAIGREGPTIQISGSIFRIVNQVLPKSWPKISKKNMIMTGAAAGLAAAFNTPLGGIVFAVEELAKTHINYFKTAIFTAVIIAGLTAQDLLGPYLYLGYPDIKNISSYIFIFVTIIAIISGLSGSLMSLAILKIIKWKRGFKEKNFEFLFVIVCAVILAFIAYFFSMDILGSGKRQMAHVLFDQDKHVSWTLPVFRLIGSIVSFTAGGAGGIFAPALGAGAAIGSYIAGLFHLLPSDTNIVILAGMVAFLTGVTRSPFTSAILVLEMTDRHNIIFQLMLSGIVASIVSMAVDKHSLYDHLKHDYVVEAIRHDDTNIEDPVV